MGEPINGRAVVDKPNDQPGSMGIDFDWEPPANCQDGCEVVFPVTIRHIGDGDPPHIGWSMGICLEYRSVSDVPPEAWEMRAVIEVLDQDGS